MLNALHSGGGPGSEPKPLRPLPTATGCFARKVHVQPPGHRPVVTDWPRDKLEASLFIVKSSTGGRKRSKRKQTSSDSKTDESPSRSEGSEEPAGGRHRHCRGRPSKGACAPSTRRRHRGPFALRGGDD